MGIRVFLAAFIASFAFCVSAKADVRIKDITNIEGVRGNDLVGYGLVVGLEIGDLGLLLLDDLLHLGEIGRRAVGGPGGNRHRQREAEDSSHHR